MEPSSAFTFGNSNDDNTVDNNLPIKAIQKIMQKVLPPDAKISDGCLLEAQKCAHNFLTLITSEADVKCKQSKRKYVSPEDVFYALDSLGFESHRLVISI